MKWAGYNVVAIQGKNRVTTNFIHHEEALDEFKQLANKAVEETRVFYNSKQLSEGGLTHADNKQGELDKLITDSKPSDILDFSISIRRYLLTPL